MPIRPEATPTGNPTAPTAGPSIKLANGENIELSWQERALCAQTDPEAFFPEKADLLAKQSASAFLAMFAKNVWNTRSHTMSVLESGVDSPNVSVAV